MRRTDNAQVFVPNSRVLEQPVANFSRRKSRLMEIRLRVEKKTTSEQLRKALSLLETQIKSLHPDLLSHYSRTGVDNPPTESLTKAETPQESHDMAGVTGSNFFAGLCKSSSNYFFPVDFIGVNL